MQPSSKNNLWDNDDGLRQEDFYDGVACVGLTFGTIFLFIAFFMALGFLVGVMTISFALPTDLYKSVWNSENG